MLHDVLDEPAWSELLTPADRRGLTQLFWTHVLPYGEVRLDMTPPGVQRGMTAPAARRYWYTVSRLIPNSCACVVFASPAAARRVSSPT